MKKLIILVATVSLLIALVLPSAVFADPTPQDLVVNGDFETGDLTGWTVFQTPNGVTNEGVTLFDTTGSGASYAAEFNVGEVVYQGTGAGGGIYQEITAPAGRWEISTTAIAAYNPSGSTNLDGGLFELLVDGVVVDSYDFGMITAGQTLRETLSAAGSFATKGSHEIRIRITRPWITTAFTPLQYVDNVNLQMISNKVTGGGTVEWPLGLDTFAFTAQHTGESAFAAKGQFVAQARDSDSRVKADVVSLAVNGNVAWMGLLVTQSTASWCAVGDEFIQVVVDNGEGKNAVAPDQMSNVVWGYGSDVSSMPSYGSLLDWTNGNVQIH